RYATTRETVPVLSVDEIQEDHPLPSRNHARAAHHLRARLDPVKDRYTPCHQLAPTLDDGQAIRAASPDARGRLATMSLGAASATWRRNRKSSTRISAR